jgi:hypothetical protein
VVQSQRDEPGIGPREFVGRRRSRARPRRQPRPWGGKPSRHHRARRRGPCAAVVSARHAVARAIADEPHPARPLPLLVDRCRSDRPYGRVSPFSVS